MRYYYEWVPFGQVRKISTLPLCRSLNRKIPSRTWHSHVITANVKYGWRVFALLKFYNMSHIECRFFDGSASPLFASWGLLNGDVTSHFRTEQPQSACAIYADLHFIVSDRTARIADENIRFTKTGYFLNGAFAAIFTGTSIQNDILPIFVLCRMQRKFRYCTP